MEKFPKEVKHELGYSLFLAQMNERYYKSKLFKGFGSRVFETAIKHNSDAYRVIYLVSQDETLYVVHCFKKKSTFGIKTPKREIDVINQRIKKLYA